MSTDAQSGSYGTMTPEDLEGRLRQGDAPRLIDVRERYEWKIVHLDGAELKPLSQIQQWWTELDPDEECVVYCHTGRRSASVCAALAAEGFHRLINLEGGIDAWARQVDPELARY